MDPPLVGIDISEPARLHEKLKQRPGLRTLLFTQGELEYCERQHSPSEHLAARFSAKEAVVKALGIDGWEPLEIEVLDGGAECGLLLLGDVRARADALDVVVTISMSHLPTFATAVAVARYR